MGTECQITLRYNYTPKNLNVDLIISQLNEIIPVNLRNKIEILPRLVWQVDSNKIEKSKMNCLFEKIIDSGYRLVDVDIMSNFTACYVERKHFNTIFHNGNVDKCSNMKPAEAKGYLNDKGEIIWQSNNDFSFNSQCFICKHFPLCMGGCSINKNQYNIAKKFECSVSDSDITDLIQKYCQITILNKH